MKHQSLQTIRDEHTTLSAMLRSLSMMLRRGPGDEPDGFFATLRAMLFYVDEFPERLHHPKESTLLFPMVCRVAPQVAPTVERLEQEHARGEGAVRELQHLLLAWELMGESRRAKFESAAGTYVDFYLSHMRLEESAILPVAEAALSDADWAELDAAFAQNRDPLGSTHPRDPVFDRLFTRIVMTAPEPIGLGSTR